MAAAAPAPSAATAAASAPTTASAAIPHCASSHWRRRSSVAWKRAAPAPTRPSTRCARLSSSVGAPARVAAVSTARCSAAPAATAAAGAEQPAAAASPAAGVGATTSAAGRAAGRAAGGIDRRGCRPDLDIVPQRIALSDTRPVALAYALNLAAVVELAYEVPATVSYDLGGAPTISRGSRSSRSRAPAQPCCRSGPRDRGAGGRRPRRRPGCRAPRRRFGVPCSAALRWRRPRPALGGRARNVRAPSASCRRHPAQLAAGRARGPACQSPRLRVRLIALRRLGPLAGRLLARVSLGTQPRAPQGGPLGRRCGAGCPPRGSMASATAGVARPGPGAAAASAARAAVAAPAPPARACERI